MTKANGWLAQIWKAAARTIFSLIFGVCAFLPQVQAAPPLTTISDTLYRADGELYSGYLQIEWKSFEAADNTIVPSQSISLRIYKGLFKTQLVPTANALSPGAVYNVRYVSDGKLQAVEAWSVPPATASLRVSAVRIAPGSVTLPPGSSTSVQISDVIGLQEQLDIRPRKGSGYSAGRTAIINELGEIVSALGAESDCMTVQGDGTVCGTQSSAVAFVDGDTPAGAVNGTNTTFVLSHAPNPVASLQVYRNGLMQRVSLDYTLTGSTITFSSTAIPQSGDILFASYRLSGSGSAAPQILCSSIGSPTSSPTANSLGTCTIPATLLQPGDRVEISADFTHEGTAKASTLSAKWGAATMVSRTYPSTETNMAIRISLGVYSSNTVYGAQNWGYSQTLGSSAGSIAVSYATPLTMDLLGNLDSAGSDTVTLRNYTVVRYPVP